MCSVQSVHRGGENAYHVVAIASVSMFSIVRRIGLRAIARQTGHCQGRRKTRGARRAGRAHCGNFEATDGQHEAGNDAHQHWARNSTTRRSKYDRTKRRSGRGEREAKHFYQSLECVCAPAWFQHTPSPGLYDTLSKFTHKHVSYFYSRMVTLLLTLGLGSANVAHRRTPPRAKSLQGRVWIESE